MNDVILQNKESLVRAKSRFKQNLVGFFEAHRLPIRFLIIAAFLDAFSTFCFMYVLGIEFEIHPLVRNVSEVLGPFIGPFIGGALKIGLGLCALIYIRRFEKTILCLAGLFYCYAFMHNLSVSGVFNLL
jgi:hypothetical protein